MTVSLLLAGKTSKGWQFSKTLQLFSNKETHEDIYKAREEHSYNSSEKYNFRWYLCIVYSASNQNIKLVIIFLVKRIQLTMGLFKSEYILGK